jgi:hypothetical protein
MWSFSFLAKPWNDKGPLRFDTPRTLVLRMGGNASWVEKGSGAGLRLRMVGHLGDELHPDSTNRIGAEATPAGFPTPMLPR